MRFIPLEFWNFVLSSTITNKERRILRPIFSFLLLHEQMKVLFFICWPCPLNSEHEIIPLFFLLWFLQGYASLPETIPRVSCALCVCCYFIDSKLKTYSLVSIIFSNKFGALVFIYFVHITGLTLPTKKKRRLQGNDENKKWKVKRLLPIIYVFLFYLIVCLFVLRCCRKCNSMKLSLTVTVTGIASMVVGELLSSFLIRAVVHLLRGRWRRLNLGGYLVIKFLLIPLRLRCILVVCYYIAQYWKSSNSTHSHHSVSHVMGFWHCLLGSSLLDNRRLQSGFIRAMLEASWKLA